MGIHEKLQKAIERAFFRGKSNKWSIYLTYIIGNIILMLLLFYILLNNLAYDWTGQLYPVGSGFRLDTVFGGLDNAIPFVPEMVLFYVYMFYPMVILTMLYFTFVEYKKGYALGWSLVLINSVTILIYIVFPVSTYWWRQDLLAHPIVGNFGQTKFTVCTRETPRSIVSPACTQPSPPSVSTHGTSTAKQKSPASPRQLR